MKTKPAILTGLMLTIALSGCHKKVGGMGGGVIGGSGVPIRAHDGSVELLLTGETTLSSGAKIRGFTVPASNYTYISQNKNYFVPQNGYAFPSSLTTPWTVTIYDSHVGHSVIIKADGHSPISIGLQDAADYFSSTATSHNYQYDDSDYLGDEVLSSLQIYMGGQTMVYACTNAGCCVDLGSN